MITINEICEGVYEDLNGCIESITTLEHAFPIDCEMKIRFDCDAWDVKGVRREFLFKCGGVLGRSLECGPVESIQLVSEHPLLWSYTCDYAYLNFYSSPENSYEIVGRLYEAHAKLFGNRKHLHQFLNPLFKETSHSLLEGGFGMLAYGPMPIMKAYAEAIGDRMVIGIISANICRNDQKKNCKVPMFDHQYVVCQKVAASKI